MLAPHGGQRVEQALEQRILILDGAMGTILFQKGLSPNKCPEELNLSQPEILKDVAEEYLRAGADIIQTNTFGGTPLKLAKYLLLYLHLR